MPKLNPNEAPEGYVAVKSGNSSVCTKCCFGETPYCNMPCVPHERADGCYVIFKRKPTKPETRGKTKCGCRTCCEFGQGACENESVNKPTKPVRTPREWMKWARVTKRGEEDTGIGFVYDSRSEARRNCGDYSVIRVKITEVKRG